MATDRHLGLLVQWRDRSLPAMSLPVLLAAELTDIELVLLERRAPIAVAPRVFPNLDKSDPPPQPQTLESGVGSNKVTE